jgi:hypothetical protein
MDLAIAIIGAAAAVAAAIAALGFWKAARKSNATADLMAGIEWDRRYQELTPEFDVTFTARDTADDSADLRVALKPGRLQRLDEVTIAILDEAGKAHWTRGLPDGVTQDEAEIFVWGAMGVQHGSQRAGCQQPGEQAVSLLPDHREELGPSPSDPDPAGTVDGSHEPGQLAQGSRGSAGAAADHLPPRRARVGRAIRRRDRA